MEEPRPGTLIIEDLELVAEEDLWAGGEDEHAGWFCVRTDPFPCPATGCTFVADFMTAAHLVLVWEERDDPNLLCPPRGRRGAGRTRGSSGTSRGSVRALRTTRGRLPVARCTRSRERRYHRSTDDGQQATIEPMV